MKTPTTSELKTGTASEGLNLARMRRPPTHPGEMFLKEYLKPAGISQRQAAIRMGMSTNRLNEIIVGKRGVTPETAILFGHLTGTSPQMWLHLQADHDLWRALQTTNMVGVRSRRKLKT